MTKYCILIALTASASAIQAQSGDRTPDGKGNYTRGSGSASEANNAASKAASPKITYHGGPVMTSVKNIYYIWYGNWSGNTATTILDNLATHLSGSPYFNINTTYTNGSGQDVSNFVVLAGSFNDTAESQGKSLSDAKVLSAVKHAINSGLPLDTNGVYFLLTQSDVNETSGFCTQYCGWHDHATVSGKDIKYGFIGNPARCLSACAAQSTSPNNNPGADGMASIISHELEEAATDPDLNAWYDSQGEENADKCAWTFGTESTALNGSKYNVTLGGMQYLIQQNWVNGGAGFCAMSH